LFHGGLESLPGTITVSEKSWIATHKAVESCKAMPLAVFLAASRYLFCSFPGSPANASFAF